jgi:hypothetical protein
MWQPSTATPTLSETVRRIVEQRRRELLHSASCAECGQAFESMFAWRFCSNACNQQAFARFQAGSTLREPHAA